LHGEIEATVLLKLFIKSNDTCQTTDAIKFMCSTLFLNQNNIQSMIPVDQTNITTQRCSTGRPFTAATQAQETSCGKLVLSEKKGKSFASTSCMGKTTSVPMYVMEIIV